jgi:hypothetical protein
MRRSIAAAALAALLFTLPVQAAQKRFSIRLEGGYAFPEENRHRGGIDTGFGVLLPITGRTSFSIEFMRWTVRSLGSPGKLYPGTVEISPIAAALRFELLRNQFFFPYAFAGAAYVFSRFEIGAETGRPAVRVTQEIDSGPAAYFGLGARLTLGGGLSFTGEVAYLARTAPARTTTTGPVLGPTTEKIVANLRTVFLEFGLQWDF